MTDAADDFDALFEEVAAQRASASAAAPVAEPAPAPAAAAVDEDDLDSLFDQVAAASAPAAAAPAVAAAAVPAPAAPSAGGDGEHAMFERLGGIVRLLHDALRELGYDQALTDASSAIVDAQDRLEYVATLTEQAANKVLNTLDDGMPAQDLLSKQAKDMETRWADLFSGQLRIDEFKALAGDPRQIPAPLNESTEAETARHPETMPAREFHDIPRQLNKKQARLT